MKRLLIGIALCLSGCANSIPERDLIGVYVATFHGDEATLTLSADHTYTHVIRLKDGQTRDIGAPWKFYDPGSSYTVITFSNFNFVPLYGETENKIGRKGKNVEWSTEIDRTWLGRIQLCVDSDVGYCYVKQAGS